MLNDVLKITGDAIKRDLLAPQGLTPPAIPLKFATPSDDPLEILLGGHDPERLGPLEVGRTAYNGHDPLTALPEEIQISTWIADNRLKVAATLAHELIHASLPYCADKVEGKCQGHGPTFTRYARAIGLEGPPTATWAGPKFRAWFERAVVPLLPVYDTAEFPRVPGWFRTVTKEYEHAHA